MTVLYKHKTFGEHLRNLREEACLTLKEVSIAIKTDSSLLAKIERSQRQPTRQFIKEVAAFFNVSEKDLLDEFLSDQIASKIINENADLNILRVAESKVKYIKSQL
jgi:transcriptional regulator with XRE-family HTH domain